MKEQITNLRVQIDGIAQLTKGLKPLPMSGGYLEMVNSKEIEKTYDSLIVAKAWLGKLLGELGQETPYANDGKRKSVEDIEPTADKHTLLGNTNSDFNLQFVNSDGTTPSISWDNKSHIEKVDWLRQEIQHITHLVEQTIFTSGQSREFAIARTNTYNHLCEARFWLGFELQRIKEEGQ